MPDPIDEAEHDTRPTVAPTPAQATNSIAKLIITAIVALIAFIALAAAYITSHFKP